MWAAKMNFCTFATMVTWYIKIYALKVKYICIHVHGGLFQELVSDNRTEIIDWLTMIGYKIFELQYEINVNKHNCGSFSWHGIMRHLISPIREHYFTFLFNLANEFTGENVSTQLYYIFYSFTCLLGGPVSTENSKNSSFWICSLN